MGQWKIVLEMNKERKILPNRHEINRERQILNDNKSPHFQFLLIRIMVCLWKYIRN